MQSEHRRRPGALSAPRVPRAGDGYSAEQITELATTLNAVPVDVVLSATPIDLTRVLRLDRPMVRVRYELDEASGPSLADLIERTVGRTRTPA